MEDIQYTQLIITCEACGNVKRFTVTSEEECERIFREFHCENSCGRNLYSFIMLGTLHHEFAPPPVEASGLEEVKSEKAPPAANASEPNPSEADK